MVTAGRDLHCGVAIAREKIRTVTPPGPRPFPYSSFGAIDVGTQVDLRLRGDDATTDPEFRDAKLLGAAAGAEGRQTATFFIPDLGYRIEVSEVQYAAWTRHRA